MKRSVAFTAISVVMIMCSLSCASTKATKSTSYQNASEEVIQEFWVSPDGCDTNPGTQTQPFATIKQAQKTVRCINKEGLDGTIRVWLDKGVYTLTDPLTFGPEDGGTSSLKVVYEARPGQEVIISGGRAVRNWKQEDANIWTTYIKDVQDGKWYFRDLYAGSSRLTRARWPNSNDDCLALKEVMPPNSYLTQQTFKTTSPIPFDNLAQQDTEAIFLLVWSCSRKLVRSSDGTSFTTEFPAGHRGHAACEPSARLETRVFLENAPAFLDVPGEWYLDRDTGILRLKLAEGQSPESMQITAPESSKFLTVKGTKENPVVNLHFKGMRFHYANWKLPLAGYNGLQAGVYGMRYIDDVMYMLPAAIYLEYAESCSIDRSELAYTGANGIALGAGCRNNQVIGCHIDNIGGNGIVVGWREMDYDSPRKCFESDWPDPTDAPFRNTISDNRIHRCAQVQFGTVGYAEMFAAETVCSHNDIYDLPYSGISTGFTWNHAPSTQRGSRIEYNHVHNVMQLMHDGGAIYTLGYQPGTVIRNNLIEDSYYGHGIYMDEGSSRIVFENNIVNRAGINGFNFHYGHSNVLRNNIFASAGKFAISVSKEQVKPSFYFERNIVWMNRHNDKIKHGWYVGNPEDRGEMIKKRSDKNLFKMDNNLYWDTRNKELKFEDLSFAQWQEQRGQDKHSIIADPMFHNPEKGDFTLPDDSPAIKKIGFKPIDVSTVGPRIQIP